jgi:hypothetical protein
MMAIASAAQCVPAAVAITLNNDVCAWDGHRGRATPAIKTMAIDQAGRCAINHLGRQQSGRVR